MRRLFVLALASALLVSACGTSSFWPGASSGASQAVPFESATPAPTRTPAPTKAQPTPTDEATAAPTGAAGDWTKVTPAGAGFTVLMPGDPTPSNTTATGYTTSIWTYSDSNDLAFFVAELKYTKGTLTKQDPATVYANGLAGMAKSTGVTVTAQGNVTVTGHTGRSFSASSADVAAQGYLFIVGDNLYMVYAAWSPGVPNTASVNAFLKSFQFTS